MSRRLAKKAAEYSSGGRKITSTSSGSRPTSGTPGMKPIASPPITSTIGYGTPIARLAADSTTTATSREISTSSTPCTSDPFESDHTARLPLGRLAPLDQQVDVTEYLAER